MTDPVGLELTDVASEPAPVVLTMVASTQGPTLVPERHLFYYSGEEWEVFAAEWAALLKPKYASVQRVGGPGDHGLDVVGFFDEQKLRGNWHCFQCKHYEAALTPSVAFVEMAKVLLGAAEDHFNLPSKYSFVAPRGAGSKLQRYLNDPSLLASKFRESLDSQGMTSNFNPPELLLITDLLSEVDFAIFGAESPSEIIETYRASPNFALRFGGGLGVRPPPDPPPTEPVAQESQYLEKLLDVYREHEKSDSLQYENLQDWAIDHMQRQRERFFAAESLKVFSRDRVPVGTFEALQTDIHDGVVEIEQNEHESGLARLHAVLQASTTLAIDSNALIQVSRTPDRQGICHQLANEDRLTWCRRGTSE